MGALLREDAVASTARPAFYPGDRLATSTPASPPTGTSWPCSTRAAVEADEHGRPRRGADLRHGNERPEILSGPPDRRGPAPTVFLPQGGSGGWTRRTGRSARASHRARSSSGTVESLVPEPHLSVQGARAQRSRGSLCVSRVQQRLPLSERYAYATLTAVTGGNPESARSNDSPPSSVIQTVPSVIPTMKTSGLSGSPAVDRGAAVIWSGSPPVSRLQVSPWSSER